MDEYTSEVFGSLVGQIFRFHRTAAADDPPIELELLDVQSSPRRTGTGPRLPFSLLFALRSGDATPLSTLYLCHDAFERCAWFINRVTVPGRDPRTPHYEAVFG